MDTGIELDPIANPLQADCPLTMVKIIAPAGKAGIAIGLDPNVDLPARCRDLQTICAGQRRVILA